MNNRESELTVVRAKARLSSFSTAKIPLAALTIIAVLGVLAAWFMWHSYHQLQSVHDRNVALTQLQGEIAHLDELLTNSARMAAVTGDVQWKTRYFESEPRLEAAILELHRLAPYPYAGAAAKSTDSANQALVALEHRAFELFDAGQREQASALLFSAEYQEQKSIYAEGNAQITLSVRERAAAAIATARRGWLVGIVAEGTVLVIAVALGTLLTNSLAKLKQLEEDLQGDNAELEARIHDGTQHLSSANQLLGEEISVRKDAQAEEARMSLELADEARCDSLTGLLNRRGFLENLIDETASAAAGGTSFALLFVDLDHFKSINDLLGHSAGDHMLRRVAKQLQSGAREGDLVARIGGDEFVVLVKNIDGPRDASAAAQRILLACRKTRVLGGRNFRVTASIGVALYPDDGKDAETLLAHADAAMYQAKDSGRDNSQVYSHDLGVILRERLELETDLRQALKRKEFVLHYQPKVDAGTQKMLGVEALIRWLHPERGLLPPADFIPMAEETGLILPLGEWALRAACLQAKAWSRLASGPLRIAVNVSPRQFGNVDFVKMIEHMLAETGISGESLTLEITEATAMFDVEYASEVLSSLRKLGIRIALDDFGTGYSSLSSLRRMPFDSLKIDRSFVKDLPGASDACEITASIIALGHTLHLTVIAEGVETSEQLDFLQRNGCDQVQGYLTGRPVPPKELEQRFELRYDQELALAS